MDLCKRLDLNLSYKKSENCESQVRVDHSP